MDAYRRALAKAACKVARLRHGEDGQGTTEYAILVGVLVVIAIIAITVFRPKLQEWRFCRSSLGWARFGAAFRRARSWSMRCRAPPIA